MIISASRRTDIPAYYFDWFLNRLQEGFVLAPNPYNAKRVSRIWLLPDTVDCIVLWTKNPLPMMDQLDLLERFGHPFYIQYTITPYGGDIEPGLPDKRILADAFCALSQRLGAHRVIWRYDPVLLSGSVTPEYHFDRFEELCGALSGATERCIFSFADPYARRAAGVEAMEERDMLRIAEGFSKVAARYRLPLFTCAEAIDLSGFGISHAACIDKALIERVIGRPIDARRDKNQRPACGCAESADIGMYDTCAAGCAYCYATASLALSQRRRAEHDPLSPLLIGKLKGDEIITDRQAPRLKTAQSLLPYSLGEQADRVRPQFREL